MMSIALGLSVMGRLLLDWARAPGLRHAPAPPPSPLPVPRPARPGPRREVPRLAGPAERDRAADRLDDARVLRGFLPHALEQRRLGDPGAHDVHGDAVARYLARDRLGERDERALGPRVDGLVRGSDAAGVGRDGDGAAGGAALDHGRERGFQDVERALEVDPDDLVPGVLLALEEG